MRSAVNSFSPDPAVGAAATEAEACCLRADPGHGTNNGLRSPNDPLLTYLSPDALIQDASASAGATFIRYNGRLSIISLVKKAQGENCIRLIYHINSFSPWLQ